MGGEDGPSSSPESCNSASKEEECEKCGGDGFEDGKYFGTNTCTECGGEGRIYYYLYRGARVQALIRKGRKGSKRVGNIALGIVEKVHDVGCNTVDIRFDEGYLQKSLNVTRHKVHKILVHGTRVRSYFKNNKRKSGPYPGIIRDIHRDGKVDIEFDNGKLQTELDVVDYEVVPWEKLGLWDSIKETNNEFWRTIIDRKKDSTATQIAKTVGVGLAVSGIAIAGGMAGAVLQTAVVSAGGAGAVLTGVTSKIGSAVSTTYGGIGAIAKPVGNWIATKFTDNTQGLDGEIHPVWEDMGDGTSGMARSRRRRLVVMERLQKTINEFYASRSLKKLKPKKSVRRS